MRQLTIHSCITCPLTSSNGGGTWHCTNPTTMVKRVYGTEREVPIDGTIAEFCDLPDIGEPLHD